MASASGDYLILDHRVLAWRVLELHFVGSRQRPDFHFYCPFGQVLRLCFQEFDCSISEYDLWFGIDVPRFDSVPVRDAPFCKGYVRCDFRLV